MSSSNQKFALNFVFLVLAGHACANEAPSLETFLPNIYQEHFQLQSNENRYHLVINLPGGNKREEVVELKNPGTPEQYLAVMGTSNINFAGLQATVTYTADKKGYVVKYLYAPPKSPGLAYATTRPMYLNPQTLKSAAG